MKTNSKNLSLPDKNGGFIHAYFVTDGLGPNGEARAYEVAPPALPIKDHRSRMPSEEEYPGYSPRPREDQKLGPASPSARKRLGLPLAGGGGGTEKTEEQELVEDREPNRSGALFEMGKFESDQQKDNEREREGPLFDM